MHSMDEKKARAVFASVLPKIKPSAAETRGSFEAACSLIKRLERTVPQHVEIRLAGSLAKGTDLSGNNEFDIFLLFPKSFSHHEMTLMGISYARHAFAGMKTASRHAEHPYLQVFAGVYHADIVPAYKISDIKDRGSSVDRSQMHTEFINAKLDARSKDDVRLLKRFMKNFGIYGAELRVEGFSGYLCELLIAQYGSFLGLMEAASAWKLPALDIAGHHTGKGLREIFDSPLVVIDPVDPGRNVAAVVAQTSLSRFVFECRRFLKNPSAKFFFTEKRARSASEIRAMMRRRGTKCLAVKFPAPDVVPDVLWPQLKKTAQALVKRLESQDFSVFGHYYWSDGNECIVLFELDRWRLPQVKKAVGPSMDYASDVEAFVERHRDCLNLHLEHDKIVAVRGRETVDAKKALCAACKNTRGLGVPAKMEKQLERCSIIEGTAIASKKYCGFLGDYFFARIA